MRVFSSMMKIFNFKSKQSEPRKMPTVTPLLTSREEKEDEWSRAWRSFKRSRVALFGGIIIVLFYFVCFLFAEFFAPYSVNYVHSKHINAPPQVPRLTFTDEDGRFSPHFFVYGLESTVDRVTFRRSFELVDRRYPIRFFVRSEPYRIWGIIPWDVRLIGTAENGVVLLFGTDVMGRDIFSRVIFGGRISLAIGLLGVLLGLIVGVIAGSVSGYYGGLVDNVMMRSTEVIMSFPHLPLWMTLAAALPPGFSPITAFFGISAILGILGSTGLARQIRGMVLSLKEHEFVLAAEGIGASQVHIIRQHLILNCISHLIVICTLSIPGMILGETALSFLGLGIRPPLTSWGVLLSEAQHVRVLADSPWLLIPALFVIVVILAFNFLGDGLRDAFDPRHSRR